MNDSASQLAYLRDPRSRPMRWRDAGLAVGGGRDARPLGECGGRGDLRRRDARRAHGRRFDADGSRRAADRAHRRGPAARRLAAARTPERFRRGSPHTLTCGCSRISLPDGTAGAFWWSRRKPPGLAAAGRARAAAGRRLEAPVAVFAADGMLFHAISCRRTASLPAATLESLGADALATHALRAGFAAGASRIGALTFDRIGDDAATFLVATLPASAHGMWRRPAPARPMSSRAMQPGTQADGLQRQRRQSPPRRRCRRPPPSPINPALSERRQPAALRLADGCGRPLHHRLGRLHRR